MPFDPMHRIEALRAGRKPALAKRSVETFTFARRACHAAQALDHRHGRVLLHILPAAHLWRCGRELGKHLKAPIL